MTRRYPAFTTDEDTSFTTGNVLANDTDADGDTLTVLSIDTTGTLGTVTDNGDGTFDYDPNGQFESLNDGETATDTFAYTIDDGNGGTDTATVTVSIDGVTDNTAPVAVDDSVTTDEDTATTGDVLANDTDVDGDTLTVTEVNGITGDVGTSITLTSGALLTLNSDGSYTYDPNGQFESLGASDTATDSFDYTVSDGFLNDTATVDITINGVNDAPVAVDDTASTAYLTPVDISVTTLLANDTDVDSANLSIVSVSNATGGSATLNNNGTASDTSDDFVTFSPGILVGLLGGTGSFDYVVSDGNLTDTATVTVNIGGLITGGNGSDLLFGTDGDDDISGGNGNDTIEGGGGDDTIEGGNGNDVIYGDGSMDGGDGNDQITGGNGSDSLYGGAGSDTLTGGNGNDFLDGGLGSDLLTGGNGSDIFVLAAGNGTDTVTDFDDGNDEIGLSGGIGFSDLSFSGNDIILTSTSEVLATVTGFDTTTLTSSDFTSV